MKGTHEGLYHLCEHSVIYNAPLVIGEDAEAAAAVLDLCQVRHKQGFQELHRVRTLQAMRPNCMASSIVAMQQASAA